MSKKVEPLPDGSFELRVSRIYFFTGAVCACIFLFLTVWILLDQDTPSEDRIFGLFFLIFSLLGVYFIVLYRNYRLYFDNENIVVTNLLGKKITMKWSEIEKVRSNAFTGYLTLSSASTQLKVLQSLKGFVAFRDELQARGKFF
jgi:ABC-type Mn2+/Zn2+ transport system permease subunit